MVIDDFRCSLALRPIWWRHPLHVSVSLDHVPQWQGCPERCVTIDIAHVLARGSHCIEIAVSGKTNADTETDRDHAVVIDSIGFFGIQNPKFQYQGVYEPIYPEPWYGQQQAQGINLSRHLKSHDYLGWNGVWRLEFITPIFTWMHQTLDLGWIYP